jgi:hypothetical protein
LMLLMLGTPLRTRHTTVYGVYHVASDAVVQ